VKTTFCVVDCSEEYASLIAARINSNQTLELSDYFLHSTADHVTSTGAVKQTGTSSVSVIGPDEDFVAVSVLVVILITN